jgi:hypothetical protein
VSKRKKKKVQFLFESLVTGVVKRNSESDCKLTCRVGIDSPTIEVRFENLNIDAEAYVGNRGVPTMTNFFSNKVMVCISSAAAGTPPCFLGSHGEGIPSATNSRELLPS